MYSSAQKGDRVTEHEKEFERWLLAALRHGRAQLRVRPFGSSTVAGDQRPQAAVDDELYSGHIARKQCVK